MQRENACNRLSKLAFALSLTYELMKWVLVLLYRGVSKAR